jgi:hypothetical protein
VSLQSPCAVLKRSFRVLQAAKVCGEVSLLGRYVLEFFVSPESDVFRTRVNNRLSFVAKSPSMRSLNTEGRRYLLPVE